MEPTTSVRSWRGLAWHIAAFAISLLGFFIFNVAYGTLFPACVDCHAHVGVPFAYLDTGGFVGGGGLLWRGVFADSLIILAATLGLFRVLRKWPRR